MLKRILIALTLSLSSVLNPYMSLPAQADIIDPTQKYITYCLQVTNLETYSEYTFVLSSTGPMGTTRAVVNDDECFQNFGYHPEEFRLSAIPTSQFQTSALQFDKKQYKQYLAAVGGMNSDPLTLEPQSTVHALSPVNTITDVAEVEINDDVVKLSKLETQYSEDGEIKTKIFAQTVPGSWFPWSPQTFYYIAGGAVIAFASALTLLIMVVVYRRRKRRRLFLQQK